MAPTRLVLLAGGITLALLLGISGLFSLRAWQRSERAATPTPSATPETPSALRSGLPSPSPLPTLFDASARSEDADRDGLPDSLEAIYRTDPKNNDTDGDGFPDGSEVANGYDPTIHSPNDKLAIPTPTPQGPTYTEQYFDRVGLPPSRENLVRSGELDEFIATVNARGFLPAVRDEELRIVGATGKAAVAAYLDAVSPLQNAQIVRVRQEEIEAAFRALATEKNSAPLDALLAALARNVEELQKAPVPGEALSLHKQYLAGTLALRENIEVLKRYETDFVGVLVAASRIDTLGGVFRAVEEGIRDLEKKYDIG